jgi:hypothetical protein
MSLDDKTEPRGRLDLLAESIPFAQSEVTLIAGYCWGSAAVLVAEPLGYELKTWLAAPMFIIAVLLVLLATRVMKR